MLNNNGLMKKSRMQPVGLKIRRNSYSIGDKYIKSILVTALPREFGLAMLARYVSKPNLKVFMYTDQLDLDCASMLKKEYNEKEDNWKHSFKDPARQEMLEKELRSLNTYIKEVTDNNDKTWNVTIIFSVFAETEKEVLEFARDLKLRLRAEGFKVFSSDMMQENLMRLATPVFLNSMMPAEIENNIGIPLPSLGLAGMYPFIFETLKDPSGFLMAHEMVNRGVILFDQFFYKNDKLDSVHANRVNGNMTVVGNSGFGKTTTMMMLIRSYIRQHIKLVWIDPENKNQPLTKKYGGTFINWGRRGYRINIFDLKPISVEDDEDSSVMWDTETSIYNTIDDLKIILRYLAPSITDDTLSIVGESVVKLYEKFNIRFHESFKGLDSAAFPTFTDLDILLDEEIQAWENRKLAVSKELELLYDLKLKIKPMLNEWSLYFNGHTTIRLEDSSRGIVSFGTKILFEKSDNLRNALNHIMYRYAWSLCLDESQYSAFVLDEAHTQILNANSAELVAQFARRSRKYNNLCVVGTQEPKDFAASDMLTHGKAIFNNSAYKIIMHLEQDGIQELAKLVRLNENEKNLIEQCRQGDALFLCGSRRIPVHMIPTDNELREMGM